MKNANTRLQETVNFIRNNHAPTLLNAEHQAVLGALTTWIGANQAQAQQLSGHMSQNGVATAPASTMDRKYRRAWILLQCALIQPGGNWPQLAATAPRNNFQATYRWTLEAARDTVHSTGQLAQQALTELRNRPQQFLAAHKLIVNGKPNGGSTAYSFYMENGNYQLDCNGPQRGIQVQAINIPAQSYGNVRNQMDQIQATTANLHQHSLVLTTQFTGCCYCFMVNGNDLAAAHLDPQGRATGITGQMVQQAATDNGDFSNGNGGEFWAYGRIPDNSVDFGYPQAANQMIVVGVAIAGEWYIYAQIDMGANVLRVQQLA